MIATKTWRDVLQLAGYPTDVVVLDAETYFDGIYSLRNLSTIEYVKDDRFELLGWAVRESKSGNSRWNIDAHLVLEALQNRYGSSLEGCTVLAQNSRFDLCILAEHFNLVPKFHIDLMGIARHVHPQYPASLAELCKLYGLPDKGDITKVKGMTRRKRWRPKGGRKKNKIVPVRIPLATRKQEFFLAAYAISDADLEWKLFEQMLPKFSRPEVELPLMQHTIELFLKPCIRVDVERAQRIRRDMLAQIDEAMARVGHPNCEISGNHSFQHLLSSALKEVGEELQFKPDKNGKMIPAIAKTDPPYEALLNHTDDRVRNLMTARVSIKSWNSKAKRVYKILKQTEAGGGVLHVPLGYHAAHCVRGDNEVLTPEGWVPIKDWVGGYILQWDSGQCRFVEAKRHVGYHVGDLMKCSATRAPASYTPGHWIPLFRRGHLKLIQAGDRPSGAIPLAGQYTRHGTLTSDQMRVLVMAQADGHFTRSHQGRTLRFGFRKERKIHRCLMLLETADVPFDVRQEKSGTIRIVVRYRHFPKWLNRDCKSFGPWILDSTVAAREAMMEELVHWDGNREKNSRPDYVSYSTTDKKSADWVQIAAHLTNRACKVSLKRNNHPKWSDSWRCSITKKETLAYIRPSTHWSRETYNGLVYCPTGIGCWLVRSNGHVFVTHNTGRWGGDEDINLQNLGARGHPLDAEVRNVLLPPVGCVFIVADQSAVEARGTAWLAGQTDLLGQFRNGVDVYCDFASNLFSFTVRQPRDNDPDAVARRLKAARNCGKVGVLGGGYGMGPLKCQTYGNGYGLKLSPTEAADIIRTYRETYPKIVQFWKDIYNGFKWTFKTNREATVGPIRFYADISSVSEDIVLVLPSGRELRYANIAEQQGEFGKEHVIYSKRQKKWSKVYGGYLTENIVQGMCRDTLAETILRLEKLGIHTALHCHDEIVCIARKDKAEDVLGVVQTNMRMSPDWAPDLPLESEASIVPFYGK